MSHISSRLRASDIVSFFSMFDPSNLTDSEGTLSSYGLDKISVLTDFYGTQQHVKLGDEVGHSSPDLVPEDTEAEWKLGQSRLQTSKGNPHKLSYIVFCNTLSSGIPNHSWPVIPVTPTTVGRSFIDMKLVKTRLQN